MRTGVAAALLVLALPALATPGLTPKETSAETVWKMRAALNVAALQCQYDPALKAVDTYNQFSRQHKDSLNSIRSALEGSFRRRFGKGWAGQFDRYNTRLYNSYSATHEQIAFCTKMSDVGARSLAATDNAQLAEVATQAIPEVDALFPRPEAAAPARPAVKAKGKKKHRKAKRA